MPCDASTKCIAEFIEAVGMQVLASIPVTAPMHNVDRQDTQPVDVNCSMPCHCRWPNICVAVDTDCNPGCDIHPLARQLIQLGPWT